VDSLDEFVGQHAPDLLGAADARTEVADPGAFEAEVSRLLTDIWLAGPPFGDALDRARRRLAAGGGDLVDLGAVPLTAVPTRVEPDRMARVLAAVRLRVDARARRQSLVRIGQGAVAGALAVLLGLAGVQLLQGPAGGPRTAPGSTGTTQVTSRPVLVEPTPHRTARCPYGVCDWLTIQRWSLGVKQATFSRLDPRGDVLGVAGSNPMVTTVVEVPNGRMVEAGFGRAVMDSRADVGVWIRAASRRDLLPRCGEVTHRPCQRLVTRSGERVLVSRSAHVVEVYRRAAYASSWVHVRIESVDPLPFSTEQVAVLATDERLALPT